MACGHLWPVRPACRCEERSIDEPTRAALFMVEELPQAHLAQRACAHPRAVHCLEKLRGCCAAHLAERASAGARKNSKGGIDVPAADQVVLHSSPAAGVASDLVLLLMMLVAAERGKLKADKARDRLISALCVVGG